MLSLAKKRGKGKPHCSLQLPEGKTAVRPHSVVADDTIKGNNYLLHLGRFRVDAKTHFFTRKAVQHWKRLTTVAVELSSLRGLSRFARESGV